MFKPYLGSHSAMADLLNNVTFIMSLVQHMQWTEIVVITEGDDIFMTLIQTRLDDMGVQHMLVTGSEALSGEWVHDVVTTGTDSWRPLNIFMICSVTCVRSALRTAGAVSEDMGTLSAFRMSSRWLLITAHIHYLMDSLQDINITMDNVVFVQPSIGNQMNGTTSKSVKNYPLLKYCKTERQNRRTAPFVQRFCLEGLCTEFSHYNMNHTESCQRSNVGNGERDLSHLLFPNAHQLFRGRQLRVIVKKWLVFAQLRHEGGREVWYGMLLDLLHIIGGHLHFSYEIMESEDGAWGAGTLFAPADGYHGYIIRKEVDIGLAPSILIQDRWPAMDFSVPLFISSFVLVYRKTPVTTDSLDFVGAQYKAVILITFGLFLVVTCILCVLEMVHTPKNVSLMNEFQKDETKDRRTLCQWIKTLDRMMEVTGSALLLKPTEIELRFPWSRVLLCCWWCVSVVLAAAYSGTLTSLFASSQPQLFHSLEDLVSKQHQYIWGVLGNSALFVTLQTSNHTVYQQVWKGIQNFATKDKDVISENASVLIQKVRNERFVLLSTEIFWSAFGEDCDIVTVDVGTGRVASCLTFPKGSALQQPVSDIILQLQSSGVMSKLKSDWFPRVTCPEPQEVKGITLLHVYSVLLLLPVGLGVALFVLLLEAVAGRRRADYTCSNE